MKKFLAILSVIYTVNSQAGSLFLNLEAPDYCDGTNGVYFASSERYLTNDGEMQMQSFSNDACTTDYHKKFAFTYMMHYKSYSKYALKYQLYDQIGLSTDDSSPWKPKGSSETMADTTRTDCYELSPCSGTKLIFQADGNLVLYQYNQALWATNTAGIGYKLIVQGNGNIVIVDVNGKPIWAIHDKHL